MEKLLNAIIREKLLNAIASGLNVRVTLREQSEKTLEGVLTVTRSMFDYKDASDEVRELFKKELNNHLFTKLKEIEVGEYVVYGFDYGKVRPLGTLMEDANDNLAEVLLKLPSLKDGERYVFPCETYIRFMLIGKYEKEATVKPNIVCPWIMEAYNKQ
ncbi:MAG: hypothetical protein ACI4VQ_07585 [Clostridia bacterium]